MYFVNGSSPGSFAFLRRWVLRNIWLPFVFFIILGGFFVWDSVGFLARLLDVVFFVPVLFFVVMRGFSGSSAVMRLVFSEREVLFFLLFLVLFLIGTAWADDGNWSRSVHGVLQVFLLLIFARLAAVKHGQCLVDAAVMAALAASTVCLLLMICFYYENDISAPVYRSSGVMLWGLDLPMRNQLLATMVAMPSVFILAVAYCFSESRAGRLLLFLSVFVMALFVVLLQRRTGLVALFAGGIGAVFLTRSAKVVAPLLMAISVTFLFAAEDVNGYVSRGDSLRLAVWLSYLAEGSKNVWLGAGAGTNIPSLFPSDYAVLPVEIEHPHNILISTFYYLGVVGVFMLVAALSTLLWQLFVYVKKGALVREASVMWAPLVPGLVTLMFDGEKVVSPYWPSWNCLWVPVAMSVVAVHIVRQRDGAGYL